MIKIIGPRRAERLLELKSHPKSYTMFNIPYDLIELDKTPSRQCYYDPKTDD
jgi:hypothetical protein